MADVLTGDEWTEAFLYYAEYVEKEANREDGVDASMQDEAFMKVASRAGTKGRHVAFAAKLHDTKWGVRMCDTAAFEVGEILNVQVVTRNGKTWPEVFEIIWVEDGIAFGRKFTLDSL